MTTPNEDRIERLENRVDKIEDRINVNLQKIMEALEELRVASVKGACPAPGACVGLGKELEHAITSHNATMLRVERLELKLLEMERMAMMESRRVENQFHKIDTQKAWVLGAWSVVALAASIVGALSVAVLNYYLKK